MKKLFLIGLILLVGIAAFASNQRKRTVAPELKSAGVTIKGGESVIPAFRELLMQPPSVKNAFGTASIPMFKTPPARVGSNGGTVYGWIGYSDAANASEIMGMNELFYDGSFSTLFAVPTGLSGGSLDASMVYLRGGELHVLAEEVDSYSSYGYWHLVYDLSGSLISSEKLADDTLLMNRCCYIPSEDKLCGYIYTSDGYYYVTAPAANPTDITVAGYSADFLALQCMTYNPVSGKIIAVTGIGTVVEIDENTGAQTYVCELEFPSYFLTGMAYSPFDKCYYYAVCRQSADGGCSMSMLDENDFHTISSTAYDSMIEFFGIMCPDTQKVEANAPGESELISADFPSGALSGTLTYKLAGATYEGVPILGNINWELYVDNKLYKRGNSAAGSEVRVKVEELQEGNHTFSFRTNIAGNYGLYLDTRLYIGNDTPKAPKSVTLTDTKVSWDAVTEGVNDGYINPNEVTYNVYINDNLIYTGLHLCECTAKFPDGAELGFYSAKVQAVYKDKVSAFTSSADLQYGGALSLPVNFEPDDTNSSFFTIVDANGDGRTIDCDYYSFTGYSLKMFVYNYTTQSAADDWLFLPAINFPDVDKLYQFRMNAFRVDKYVEKYEIALCSAPSPDAVVKVIQNEKELVTDYTSYNLTKWYHDTYFKVPASGDYYIGVHVTSDKDMYRLCMRDFTVKESEEVQLWSPAEVTDVQAVAAEQGGLSATVTFVMPKGKIDGTSYPESKELRAVLTVSDLEPVEVDGHPGEQITVEVPTEQNRNMIFVTTYDGDVKGATNYTSIYTGFDKPSSVVNLSATPTEDDMALHLTWEAPTQGQTGGYIDPETIKYYLCEYTSDGWTVTQEIGENVYSYDAPVPSPGKLQYVTFGIITANAAGYSSSVKVADGVIGKPFAMPATSSYRAGSILTPVINNTSSVRLYTGDPKRRFSSFSSPDNSEALYSYATKAVTNANFSIPKFSTKGAVKPSVEFEVYGGSCKSWSVYASTYGDEEETLLETYSVDNGNLPSGSDASVVLELPDKFKDKDWVQLTIYFSTANKKESFILYAYRYFDNLDFDFGVTGIEGSSQATLGEENIFTAHAVNYGGEANCFPGATWTLTGEDGQLIASVPVAASEQQVEPGEEFAAKISFTPTVENLGSAFLKFELNSADDKATNDSATFNFDVIEGFASVVTDLRAEDVTYDAVTLAWTAPQCLTTDQGFEDETPFVLDEECSTVAGFTRVDGDGAKVYGPNNSTFASQPYAFAPQSFVVWSESAMTEMLGSNLYPAHTGDKYLVARCPSTQQDGSLPAADDWLISPAVSPASYVKFSVRPITYAYGAETLEVLYSDTSASPEDFKLLDTLSLSGDTKATPIWSDYQVQLPANAKYFALHYVSQDIFGIMIDDISYVAADAGSTVAGYDIYRDSRILASNVACDGCTYLDNNLEESSEYSYFIVPVLYDGSRGLTSNTVVVSTTSVGGVATLKAVYAADGCVVVKGYEGKRVVLSDLYGRVVAAYGSAPDCLKMPVGAGIYLVKVGDEVFKLIAK